MSRKYKGRKGITTIRLFKQTWKFGRVKRKNGKEKHLVIYGPEDQEYDVYGKDVENLLVIYYDWYDEPVFNRKASKIKVKNYILTNILDDGSKWKHDMVFGPRIGKRVKVLYEGSTIKWVEFKGSWEDLKLKIETKIPMKLNPEWLCKKTNSNVSQWIWEIRTDYKKIIAWRK